MKAPGGNVGLLEVTICTSSGHLTEVVIDDLPDLAAPLVEAVALLRARQR